MEQFTNMFALGGGRRAAEGGRGSPQTPPPAQQRRSQDNDSFGDYSLVSNQQGRSVAGPPTGDVEFSFHGSKDPTTIRVATASQPRERGDDRYHTETAQAGPGPGGAGNSYHTTPPGGAAAAGGTRSNGDRAYWSLLWIQGVIETVGTKHDTTAARDLTWQRDININSNTQKIKQFQEVVGGLQDFRTYLFMKPGSAFVTVLHSPMKLVAISEATEHLQ